MVCGMVGTGSMDGAGLTVGLAGRTVISVQFQNLG